MQDRCRSTCLHFVSISVRRHTLFSYRAKSGGRTLLDGLRNRSSSRERRYLIW